MDSYTMQKRIETLKNDTKIGYQFVETHEDAIIAALDRLDVDYAPSGLTDRPLHFIRKVGHFAHDSAERDNLDRDALFLFGIATVNMDTFRAWENRKLFVAAYNAQA
jgi:hypothetical protein